MSGDLARSALSIRFEYGCGFDPHGYHSMPIKVEIGDFDPFKRSSDTHDPTMKRWLLPFMCFDKKA
jgi:hypothetical protein